MGHDDMENSDEEDAQAKTKNKGDDTNQPTDDEAEQDKEAESKGPTEEDISETDEAFRRKEHTLVDKDENGDQVLVGNSFNKEVAKKLVIPYKQLAEERKARLATLLSVLYFRRKNETNM